MDRSPHGLQGSAPLSSGKSLAAHVNAGKMLRQEAGSPSPPPEITTPNADPTLVQQLQRPRRRTRATALVFFLVTLAAALGAGKLLGARTSDKDAAVAKPKPTEQKVLPTQTQTQTQTPAPEAMRPTQPEPEYVEPTAEDEEEEVPGAEVGGLQSRLRRVRFAGIEDAKPESLQACTPHLEGGLESMVKLKYGEIVRKDLKGLEPGKRIPPSVLDAYVEMLKKHHHLRSFMDLQAHCAVAGPVSFEKSVLEYIATQQPPTLPEDFVTDAQKAERVVIILPVPDWNTETNTHGQTCTQYAVAVIERNSKQVTIIDTNQRPSAYYNPLLGFLKAVATQIDGDPTAEYSHPDTVPEPGFPTEPPVATRADLENASGPMVAEIVTSVAESRRPNFSFEDVPKIRDRMLVELIEGLYDRHTVNNQVRVAMY